MLGLLKAFFRSPPNRTYCLQDYRCDTVIRLPKPISPPHGCGKYTIVWVQIDIWFRVVRGKILIDDVRMAKKGYELYTGGAARSGPLNIASVRRGEAWYLADFPYSPLLREVVNQELSKRDSKLRRLLLGIWHSNNRPPEYFQLLRALNEEWAPERIQSLLEQGARHSPVSFTYLKPDETPYERHVLIHDVSGNCIRAIDKQDGQWKTFRIDRIRDARVTPT